MSQGPHTRLDLRRIERLPGDFLIEGEEESHRKARGWSYWISWCDADGHLRRIHNPDAELKAAMKSAGCPVELLPGAGMIAACVRVTHAARGGYLDIDAHGYEPDARFTA